MYTNFGKSHYKCCGRHIALVYITHISKDAMSSYRARNDAPLDPIDPIITQGAMTESVKNVFVSRWDATDLAEFRKGNGICTVPSAQDDRASHQDTIGRPWALWDFRQNKDGTDQGLEAWGTVLLLPEGMPGGSPLFYAGVVEDAGGSLSVRVYGNYGPCIMTTFRSVDVHLGGSGFGDAVLLEDGVVAIIRMATLELPRLRINTFGHWKYSGFAFYGRPVRRYHIRGNGGSPCGQMAVRKAPTNAPITEASAGMHGTVTPTKVTTNGDSAELQQRQFLYTKGNSAICYVVFTE
ncbi:uncharacterized protein EI90DRAFT_3012622 [Cantharellus anzutake]|uniref:uncharacterized protein n=1 Tax=Cantharellus anzutake TaxID=1750568 RepID=UPI001907BB65|nr:uncharacterized protein EI90DRAFT_3012622 [Cantharellus anzutake]KAF8339641.1 hypothetical protein EI90DRAFT_3012622 [Cantharellus anzutake]